LIPHITLQPHERYRHVSGGISGQERNEGGVEGGSPEVIIPQKSVDRDPGFVGFNGEPTETIACPRFISNL
jgi:hypothetical protein